MRALLTGGAGFIGTALGLELANRGYEVTALDNLHPQVHPTGEEPPPPPGGHFVLADVTRDDELLDVAGDGFDVVVHLAAETGTAQSLDEASRHALVNVVGTTRLLDAFTDAGCFPGHIVLPSSRAVYGEGEWQEPDGAIRQPFGTRKPSALAGGDWSPNGVDPAAQPLPSAAHRTTPSPTNVYAATKLAQEHLLRAWCIARETPLSVLRLQNVYGPGQSPSNPYSGVMVFFAALAMSGRSIPVYEDGAIVRDFVFVDDVVAALASACTSIPGNPRVVDVGTGRPVTIRQVADVLAHRTGAPPPTVTGRYRLGDVRAAYCDIDAAAAELDWFPRVSLEQGVEQLLTWLAECERDDVTSSSLATRR